MPNGTCPLQNKGYSRIAGSEGNRLFIPLQEVENDLVEQERGHDESRQDRSRWPFAVQLEVQRQSCGSSALQDARLRAYDTGQVEPLSY